MNVAGLRARVRAAREVPVFGALVRAADRVWWWRAIRRSGLVDAEYYAAQLGVRRIGTDTAIWHYVARGFRRGLSLNPLFDEIFAGGGLPEVFRVPALYAYLVGERATIAVHPWWDAVATTGADGVSALERVWSDHSFELTLRAGERHLGMTVSALRERSIDAARDWSRRGRRAHTAGSLAIESGAPAGLVRFVQARDRRYHRKLDQAAQVVDAGGVAVSIAMVDVDASQWASACILAAIEPRVSVRLYSARRTWGSVLTDEVATLRAQRLLAVLDARAEFSIPEIEALWVAAESACAIPAHRALDGTLTGLGAARVGPGQAYRILRDHPHEDAGAIPDRVLDVPLATGRTFAVELSAYRAAGGIPGQGPGELELLSERLRADGIPSRVLLDVLPVLEEPEIAFRARRGHAPGVKSRRVDDDRQWAEHIIVEAGFDVRGWRFRGAEAPTPVLGWRRPSPDALRWAIKICAPAGRQGEVWGDTHFAKGLANALRRRGHTVVIDAFDARDRATGYLDDVSVAIRGPYRIDAPRWGVSMQWIISHPDEVTRAEAAGYDRVFAASTGWARRNSQRWGLRIDALLEATDTDQFHPAGLERGTDIVFVGTARGIPRPSVVAPLAAGIPVRVYGPDWRPFIPHSAIAARSIPNSDLPARYETASIVLNDQWPAMRREGFIAMRPFDAVAVGGRVISEAVDGIEEIFEGAVVAYRDAAHLVELLQTDAADLFPTDEQMAEISARIRREHSFDARAEVLDSAAAELIAEAQAGQR